MQSCIYHGRIVHIRRQPVEHKFTFDACLMMLDLDELDDVFRNRRLWSTTQFAFARFQCGDHMRHIGVRENGQLKAAAIETLRERGINSPIGPIRLLTNLRYLGFAMNPVSFYYCYDETDTRVVAVIAEVNNTPWGEQHIYVIDKRTNRESATGPQRTSTDSGTVVAEDLQKNFHVSPFMNLDMQYNMRFSPPANKLSVSIENMKSGNRLFNVVMKMNREPITSASLRRVLVQYPLMSWKTFAGIYWQALRLYLKGVPFHPHPSRNSSPAPQAVSSTNTELTATQSSNASSVEKTKQQSALASP